MHSESATAVTALLRRAEWRDSTYGTTLRGILNALLEDAGEPARMLSTYGLPFVEAEIREGDKLFELVATRTRDEKAASVQSVLLQFIWHFVDTHFPQIDSLLLELQNVPYWSVFSLHPSGEPTGTRRETRDELALDVALRLAVVHDAGNAKRFIEEMFTKPVLNPHRALRLTSKLRGYVKPEEPETTQARSFAFLQALLNAVGNPSNLPTEQQKFGYEIVDNIVDQLFLLAARSNVKGKCAQFPMKNCGVLHRLHGRYCEALRNLILLK
jgi:hypothetical protein